MDKKKRLVLIVLLSIFCFVYLFIQNSQAAYESTISGRADNDIADWSIKVNDQEITNNTGDINLSYTLTNVQNVREGKVAPGASLVYPITIDASGSEVAMKITFTVTDKSVDSDKYLTLTGITSSDLTLVRVSVNSYSAIIPKEDLTGTKELTMNFSWIDTGELIEYNPQDDSDSFVEIEFNAIQYSGETLTPYNE